MDTGSRARSPKPGSSSAALEVDAQKSVQRNVVADLGARLRDLLAKNADATAKGQRGKRPVEIANAFGAEPLVAALVAAGAKAPASVAATDEKPQAKGKGAKKGTKK